MINNNSFENNPSCLTLHQLFEKQVEQNPNSLCISCENDQLTYAEVNERANQFANYLNRSTLSSNKVALCLERSIGSVIIMLGILKSGNAYVPLDPNSPYELTHFILKNSGAQTLITQNKFLNHFENMEITALITEIFSKEVRAEDSLLKRQTQTSGKDVAAVLYTSGTTSKPKGVCLTHQGLVNRIVWMQHSFQVNFSDRILNKTSVCFDISIWEIFLPLISGGVLVCAGAEVPKDSDELVRLIQHEKITIIHFVPQMLKYFLDTKNVEKCTSLRHVFVSGDVLYPHTQERFFSKLKCDLHNLYGPTETSIDVTHWHCQPNSKLSFVPIGKPIANTQIYILDDNFNAVETSKIGQIYIAGECLAQGYTDKELTDACFINHPKYGRLYRTGDLARLAPDGNIEFICRNDRQVKLGGYRVELSAIEEVIASDPDIHSVAITYQEDVPGFKKTIGYIVVKNNNQIENYIDNLTCYLKTKLPLYMVPNIFAVIDHLPLTLNFKINYPALPKLDDLKKIKEEIYCSK